MGILIPQPFNVYSIRQLSKLIKSSYALTHESIQSLIKKDLIKTNKIGNSISCQLNLSSDPQLLAISSLIYSEKFIRKSKFGFLIDDLKEKLCGFIYIMALFGSHAKGISTKKSDIDLLFIVQNEEDIEKTKKSIKTVLSSTSIKIDFDVITTEWLLKMFEEKHSVGREVLDASIILHGAEQYYGLVRSYDKRRGH